MHKHCSFEVPALSGCAPQLGRVGCQWAANLAVGLYYMVSLPALPQVFSAAVMSFTHGANDVSNAMGPYAAVYGIWSTGSVSKSSTVPEWILVLGTLLSSVPVPAHATPRAQKRSGQQGSLLRVLHLETETRCNLCSMLWVC